jgi:hypothetical protein
MVKATDCVIDIELALSIREMLPTASSGYLGFRCRECGQPVKPHRGAEAPTDFPAHFEHIKANPNCSRSGA